MVRSSDDAAPSQEHPTTSTSRWKADFSEEEILALTLAIVAINGWNRFAVGLGLSLETTSRQPSDGSSGGQCVMACAASTRTLSVNTAIVPRKAPARVLAPTKSICRRRYHLERSLSGDAVRSSSALG